MINVRKDLGGNDVWVKMSNWIMCMWGMEIKVEGRIFGYIVGEGKFCLFLFVLRLI